MFATLFLQLKTHLIAIAIGIALGSIIGGYACWKLQGFRIERMEVAEQKRISVAKDELQVLTEKVVTQERKNSEITQQLEGSLVAKQKRVDELLTVNRDLLRKYGGMYVSGSCKAQAGTPTIPSGNIAAEATTCRVSDEVASTLLNIARDADSTAEYANACYEYIWQINRQRDRIEKEQE